MEATLLVIFGAFVGSLVSAYRCNTVRESLPNWGSNVDSIVCTAVGAVVGALAFWGLPRLA
jgi:hypothetical protein